ncbi:oxygenase MpaB family protein [Saxibacter everestensis]|uniref:Oxygenase MpaB family protein n=1 Tax=Saxibacter everestensis TaxID=2909229 RepID=A0ABY8QNM3_9MICO|nr:oxygenase MpaB family protein [Brevibacteriaceae bacterium ZFBP1038]
MIRFSVPHPFQDRLRMTFAGQAREVPEWELRLADGDDAGYFRSDSAVWTVHREMATIVAGIRALLMQALHPGAMAGVRDWSNFRDDPLGRLAGTIRWIFTVTYGDTKAASEGTAWVRKLHERVRGSYLDAKGREVAYSANDPELLSWVHLAFTDSFLATHRIWGKRFPGDEDDYVREWAIAGDLMGVPEPPRSAAELQRQLNAFYDSGVLCATDTVRETIGFLRRPPLALMLRPGYRVLFGGAVASLEPKYRELLGLEVPNVRIGGRGSIRLPVISATRIVLGVVGRALGDQGPSEQAARSRLARLADAQREKRPEQREKRPDE